MFHGRGGVVVYTTPLFLQYCIRHPSVTALDLPWTSLLLSAYPYSCCRSVEIPRGFKLCMATCTFYLVGSLVQYDMCRAGGGAYG